MRNRKGFTLIELMVVVLIVAVLAAVLVPLMTARLESAKWSEGKAGAGTIASSVRAMAAEYGQESGALPTPTTNCAPYAKASDLNGKWFDSTCYSFDVAPRLTTTSDTAADQAYPAVYKIRVKAPDTGWTVQSWTLDQTGTWKQE